MASNQVFQEEDFEELSDEFEIDRDKILFNAIENEPRVIVKEHLDLGSNPNASYLYDVENEGKIITPLLKAFERNRMDVAEILLNGAIIGYTLPHVASSRKAEFFDFLLKSCADDVDNNDEKCTPLHLAVKNNSWELFHQLQAMKILLENGANINAKDSESNTPLHCAVFIGNIEIIKLLLEYDIDIDAVDIDGDSALLLAEHEENAEIVETLLQNYKKVQMSTFKMKICAQLYFMLHQKWQN